MEIKVFYHSEAIDRLQYVDGKSDWIDLRAAENYSLKKGDFALINLGVSIQIPEGYEAHLAPRSSTFKRWGILQTNSVGVIDNSYSSAEDIWMMPVYATRDTEIQVNDRVCQFRIVENQPHIDFREVSAEELPSKVRGGFGSTGKA